MQFILTSSRPRDAQSNRDRVKDVTNHVESVRFTDDGLGWTHRYGGSSDGIRLELLDKDGNVNGETTLREADILSMARALQKAHKV